MPGGGEVFPHCVCFVVDLVLLLHAKTAVVGLLLYYCVDSRLPCVHTIRKYVDVNQCLNTQVTYYQ